MFKFKLFRFNVLDQLPATENETLVHAQNLNKLLASNDQEAVFNQYLMRNQLHCFSSTLF
jgi:hypothetical protein